MANEDLLEVIFWHLLLNALKFARPGRAPLIQIRAESQLPEDLSLPQNFAGMAGSHVRFRGRRQGDWHARRTHLPRILDF
jgi:hypothetical protein